MKSIALISALLTMILPASGVNAYTVETIGITETGGIITSGQASASDTEDAQATVRSVIQGGGSNTRVRIDISARAGDDEYATSVSRTIERNEPAQARAEASTHSAVAEENGGGEEEVAEEANSAPALALGERFSTFFARLFDFLFFFW